MTKVSIVIVNWNAGRLLSECLQSLERLPEKKLIQQVVVVDNNSSDDSVEWAKTERGDAVGVQLRQAPNRLTHFIQLNDNAGFARANNIGITFILKHSGRDNHVLLLNPDTAVQPGAVAEMVRTLEANPETAVVGPKLLDATGQHQPSVRLFPTLAIFVFLFLKLHRLWPHFALWRHYMQADFNYAREAKVDQVMGAACLIRNSAWRDVGMLDEGFWIWFEEVDYCKRVKARGGEVVYTPNAVVKHHGAASFNQLVGLRRSFPFIQSALRYARKHLGFAAYLILLLLAPLALLLSLPASLVHVARRRQNRQRL